MQGLSPRVRGNRNIFTSEIDNLGSIPACAGEPFCRCLFYRLPTVYPRVCGGTLPLILLLCFPTGLSPRVRGNRAGTRARNESGGSIPACAGEPIVLIALRVQARVYPRVCGGTGVGAFYTFGGVGLSPRVRGNRVVVPEAGLYEGSIPACAGEPHQPRHLLHPRPVYPRVCGEPSSSARLLSRQKVYPRVCGGTKVSGVAGLMDYGLSPRVRGNPVIPHRNRER